MKLTVLALGLWLTGAPAFVTVACLPSAAATKADCGGCDGQTGSDSSCCITVRAQDEVNAAVPKNDLPEKPTALEYVTVDSGTTYRPEAAEDVIRQAAARAEGPSLYLRNSVLLI